jgi:anti-sigma B factor antagonist
MNQETKISLQQNGDIIIFDIQGDVTSFSEPVFQETYQNVNKENISKILLKFYENVYINSGGIAVLIQLLAVTKRNNQKIFITGLSSHFQKILNMVGITKFAKIYTTVEEAIKDI